MCLFAMSLLSTFLDLWSEAGRQRVNANHPLMKLLHVSGVGVMWAPLLMAAATMLSHARRSIDMIDLQSAEGN